MGLNTPKTILTVTMVSTIPLLVVHLGSAMTYEQYILSLIFVFLVGILMNSYLIAEESIEKAVQ